MKRVIALCAAASLAACATSYNPQEVEAVRDYVSAAELVEVDRISTFGTEPFSFSYINDFFVVVPSRRDNFLVELQRQCQELRRTDFSYEMVDRRTDANSIRPRFDTIRGCRIAKIYAINKAQLKELKNLGDAPGEEVFLPENDD